MIDLKPYELLLERFGSEVIKLGKTKVQVTERYSHKEKYLGLLYSLEHERIIMELKWKEMKSYLKRVLNCYKQDRKAL